MTGVAALGAAAARGRGQLRGTGPFLHSHVARHENVDHPYGQYG